MDLNSLTMDPMRIVPGIVIVFAVAMCIFSYIRCLLFILSKGRKDVYFDQNLDHKVDQNTKNKLSTLYQLCGHYHTVTTADIERLRHAPMFHFVSPKELSDIKKRTSKAGVKIEVLDADSAFSTRSVIRGYGLDKAKAFSLLYAPICELICALIGALILARLMTH